MRLDEVLERTTDAYKRGPGTRRDRADAPRSTSCSITPLRSHVSGTADEAHSYEDGTKQWKSYDLASEQEKMEQRDREAAEDIEIDDPEDTEDKP